MVLLKWGGLIARGTLEPGKFADLIILDRNPMTVPVGEIHATKVLATYIAGEKVFSASE